MPISIGSRLELLVDDFLIDSLKGAELTLNSPVVRETVFQFDAPWEGDTCAYVTIFRDGERYRMYYRGSSSVEGQPFVTCTAESPDGICWTRPKLGLFEWQGSSENNILWMGTGCEGFTPFKDMNPSARPDERYKAVGSDYIGGRRDRVGLFAYKSSDGYRWEYLQPEPIMTQGAFDSQNLAFWDAQRQEYVCYFRGWRDGARDILRATSQDFHHWSKGEWLDYPNVPREELYTNAITPYFRAPHLYMGFPKRFVADRKRIASHAYSGVSDGVFMTSRDGLSFQRWREAFMRPGADPDNWTERNIMAAWGISELSPHELSLYYSQHYRHAANHLVRASIRTDGFVSAKAKASGGEIITKPLLFAGAQLLINYATSAAGGVRVELQDAEGKPIPGFLLEDCPVIYGDEIAHAVCWNSEGDLSHLAGKPIRIRFQLADADLYSFRFR